MNQQLLGYARESPIRDIVVDPHQDLPPHELTVIKTLNVKGRIALVDPIEPGAYNVLPVKANGQMLSMGTTKEFNTSVGDWVFYKANRQSGKRCFGILVLKGLESFVDQGVQAMNKEWELTPNDSDYVHPFNWQKVPSEKYSFARVNMD